MAASFPWQGEQFGQRRPPLSVTIKSILERYPDGQIFKEMIQNADDAGAKTVQFYIDSRQHGSQSLVNPKLAQFQGPALIAANDASFSDDDWEGIQRLQHSIKAEDPFKVGRFGIGFNSVYHITDVPTIISGEKIVYLDPQEEIWPGQSGKLFRLANLQGTDSLAPFRGIAGFPPGRIISYPQTLFRFPLRSAPSSLSENIYTTQKMQKLTDALREEAKYLLPFLRSVNKIELYNISQRGVHSLSFGVQIASRSQGEVGQKRSIFMAQLRHAHALRPYGITETISFSIKFEIEITDNNHHNNQSGCSSWLVSNAIGSRNSTVISVAKKQHVFPWVGTSLQIPSGQGQSTPGGRIYCFLPLPIEASSNLPVNVNGTFSLNDERRTLKWPGRERTNDPMAEWNKLLITELLPPCYAMLLEEAKKCLQSEQLYNAWPDIRRVRGSDWEGVLRPLFTILFSRKLFWSSTTLEWSTVHQVTFIPKSTDLLDVVKRVLTICKIKLVSISPRVWNALDYQNLSTSVKQVSPRIVRREMIAHLNSYKNESLDSKLELLKYCLSDRDFSDLHGLQLLPLANHTVVAFQSTFFATSSVVHYLCSNQYPYHLLPNISHLLVDVKDYSLQSLLQSVASSGCTQLQALSVQKVAALLPSCFPPEWAHSQTVSLPSPSFPSDWFQIFWNWVQSHDLSSFASQLVVPIAVKDTQHGFKVTRLVPSSNSAVVYIAEHCSPDLLSALTKLQVQCTISSHVNYLRHRQLFSYVNQFNSSGVLTATACANQYIATSFSSNEASQLQTFLASRMYSALDITQQNTLKNLALFKSVNTTGLFSAIQASNKSWGRKTVKEPPGLSSINASSLPSNLVILSNDNQSVLLQKCSRLVTMPSTLLNFVLDFIFPMIKNGKFPEDQLDSFMEQILKLFPVLKQQDSSIHPHWNSPTSSCLVTELSNLPFLNTVRSSTLRRTPKELYDPLQPELKKLFEGESVFPLPPFNQKMYLQHLYECGLQKTVKPQNLYAILGKVSSEYSDQPQKVKKVQVRRAKAILSFVRMNPNLLSEKVTTTTSGFKNLADAVVELFKRKNCLPVLAQPVYKYPKCLVWKGSTCVSHLATLNDSVLLCSSKDMEKLPYIVGSQMYVVDCPSVLGSSDSVLSNCTTPINPVLSHFKCIIEQKNEFEISTLNNLVEDVYSYLLNNFELVKATKGLSVDLFSYAWIWIRKQCKFVSPNSVALMHHDTFRHSLFPYLNVIPDHLQKFSRLFTCFGVQQRFTDFQIISVLQIIKEDHKIMNRTQHSHYLTMVVQILEWLTDNGDQLASKKLTKSQHLYVPVETQSNTLCLVEADKVVYTDLEFLKKHSDCSKEEKIHFIHPRITHLALSLGTKPLSAHLNIAEDAFGDVGQHEPLVTRLRNILRDYKDGLTIIKELLQNADDAEATELNICYDARTHETDPKKLFFSGMSECHGPALVVHNNAVFTAEDFENITKLAGATKLNKPLKIGKFGVGFCSVYHITDVPSFVSKEWLYIFDPTLRYLTKEVIDRSRPGKKLRFTEELVQHTSQLQPYTNLFGFVPKQEFQGTLFRFPFRTSRSEISSVIYDKVQVEMLLSGISKAGSKLLLFLKNIKKIRFSHITSNDCNPTILCEIRKDLTLPYSVSNKKKRAHTFASFLEENTCCITEICTEDNSHRTRKKAIESWLISSHNTNASQDRFPNQASCSVACRIVKQKSSQKYIPKTVKGEMFCFLPLGNSDGAIETGLPVHITCNFAVLNDRSGICSTSDSQSGSNGSVEIEWNRYLMKEVIPKAYLTLLSSLQVMCHQSKISMETYKFYMLWPLKKLLKTHTLWDSSFSPLYELISENSLFFSSSIHEWRPLDDCKLISRDILNQASPRSGVSPPKCVIDVIASLNYPLVDLPEEIKTQFPEERYLKCIINEDAFLAIFFAHIERISIDTRNDVLFHLFDSAARLDKCPNLQQYIEGEKCVPCTPNGLQLKKCSEVVDPNSEIAELFDQEDGVFPIAEFHTNRLIRTILLQANMITNCLPWTMIIERALAIEEGAKHQTKHELLVKRSSIIIECIAKNLYKQLSSSNLPSEASNLATVSFLPVLKKPKTYPLQLQWGGERYRYLSCVDLLTGKRNIFLAGSQVPVLCESEPEDGGCGPIPKLVKQACKLRNEPSHVEVLNHFGHIVSTFSTVSHTSKHQKEWQLYIQESCDEIYAYLEKHLGVEHIDLKTLKTLECIWTGTQFVPTTSVATNWNHDGPFLFALPPSISSKDKLLQALGIGEPSVDQLLNTLKQMYDTFGARKLGNKEMKILPQLLAELVSLLGIASLDQKQVCYLPDKECRMHDTSQLVFNDAPWCELDQDCYVVHNTVSRTAAVQLNVKLIRTKALEQYESSVHYFKGDEFGQQEHLTQRIKNILSEYPCDVTVIKELLQNADDAKATKMYVILDKRCHGTHKLPSTEWKDLQGPALLVWNDKGFSEDDFRGIQQVGLGSKRQKWDSIGKFGIGFNVVYHLTDCPSFVTNGNALCVLDPHCRYVPGANQLKPGRKYDVNDGFWRNWDDLKSTYLYEDIDGCPQEMIGSGTLFRFPLRHNNHLVRKSQLIVAKGNSRFGTSNKPLSPQIMESNLRDWAPKLKEALLFLNHVADLKFFDIQGSRRNSQMKLTHHFKLDLDQKDLVKRNSIQENSALFCGQNPCLISYPLKLCEEVPQKDSQRFLVQQGVGDVQNSSHSWKYLQDMKPIHGIAARIDGHMLKGSLFCFLPLAIKSHLPVHINGNFILDSARSGLWQSRDSDNKDDRMLWNQKLFQSLASSYAIFLNEIRKHFVSLEQIASRDDLLSAVKYYYDTFPRCDTEDPPSPTGDLKLMTHLVYEHLGKLNFSVLASLVEVDSIEHSFAKTRSSRQLNLMLPNFRIQWMPLTNTMERNKQAYFWEGTWNSELLAIIKSTGMSLTVAPMWIKLHFGYVDLDLPQISPSSVYEYYSNFYEQITQNGKFPCHISSTTFANIENFSMFTKYLLTEVTSEIQSGSYFEFPKVPFGLPLLITADEQLRSFDEENKSIVSHYSSIFTNTLEKFLHPTMLGINFPKSYFVEPNESNWLLIRSILSKILPQNLCTKRVYYSSDHISIESVLSPLWSCFAEEKIFSLHILNILQEWALIPSTNNELFALPNGEDTILPVIPPTDHKSEIPYVGHHQLSKHSNKLRNFEVFEIVKSCGMPVCDVIVSNRSLCQQFCPLFTQPDKILANMYLIFQSGESNFVEISKKDINTLLIFFRTISFQQDTDSEARAISLSKLKSLPIFEGVDNRFYAINDETFIWPKLVCLEGKDVISENTEAVLLKQDGNWKTLRLNVDDLGIESLSPSSFYVEVIFPCFEFLSEQDRFCQLLHIRDKWQIFCISDSETHFIDFVRHLNCLPKDGTLKPVQDFCDPTSTIFENFPDSEMFEFPPQQYWDEKWLNFFREIGLRTKITQKEFILLCKKISLGYHNNIEECSNILLDILFSEYDWSASDQQEFLNTVSQIAFVCADSLTELSAINPIFNVSNVIQHGSKTIYLTSLAKSTGFKHRYIAWTQMPVVKLPNNASTSLCKKLGMCVTPSCIDVIQNVMSISKSSYSDFSLFEQYSRGPSVGINNDELLLNILKENFLHLMKHTKSCSAYVHEMIVLQHVPCIPVSSIGETEHITSPVLVCPIQVIASTSDELKQFVPFINPLPSDLYSVLPTVLAHIGVSSEIRVSHIAYALQTIHQHIQFPYDPNTVEMIEKLLKKMYDLLQDVSNKPDFGDMILYLPNTAHQLTESKMLLYNDTTSFQAYQYDLSEVSYSFFSMLIDKKDHDFQLNKFCEMLPESVRPLPVSTICSYSLHESCVPKTDMSHFAAKLKQSFQLQGFGDCALRILSHASNSNRKANEQFAQSLNSFIKSVELLTVEDLVEDIYLKITDPPSKIGSAGVDFLLVDSDESVQLYIDNRVDGLEWNFFKLLTKTLVSHVCSKAGIDVSTLCEPDRALEMLLRVSSSNELLLILNKEGIDTTQLNLGDQLDLTPSLGATIPEHWHHRLQAGICNVFRPQEWVGFERRENHYVFALVKHQINPVLEEDPGGDLHERDEDNDLPMFLIQVQEDDEEEKVASILELHKFLRIKQIQRDDGSTEDILYNPDCTGTDIWDLLNDDQKMNEVMIAISDELRQIWKIKNKLKRRKAIKSMYLKWHPDKNLHNPLATKGFQFLQRQINRLQQSLPLEDPIADEWETGPEPHHTYWEDSFNSWNRTASRHFKSWQKEQTYRQSRAGDEYFDQFGDSKFEWKWEKDIKPQTESSMAMVWLQQAEYDLTALYLLMAHTEKIQQVSAHVCFLAHQVVEKSLKAGMYKECGLHPNELKNHKLVGHAGALEGLQPVHAQGLLKLVTNFECNKYYLKTRYPNAHKPPSVPSKVFEKSDAIQAQKAANTVHQMIRNLIYCKEALKTEEKYLTLPFLKPEDLPLLDDSKTLVTASGMGSPSIGHGQLPTVTYLNDIITFECNSVGQEYKLVDYDIIVTVPPDAIPEGEKVQFEVATCLFGPFKFPEDKRPISPIIWLCTKNKIDLKKPIEIVLPHILTGQYQCDQHGICFAKADHTKYSERTLLYKFNICDTKPELFSNECGSFGALKTNHCCYLCILANKDHDTALQAGYCLSRIEYTRGRSRDVALYGVYFCATFCLSTCMDVLKKQFPNEEGYKITSCHPFKFEDGPEPCIELDLVKNQNCKTALTPKMGKISLSEIDFWDQCLSQEDMECRQDAKVYPPRCQLEVSLVDKTKATVVAVSFLGCKHNCLDMEIMFPLGTSLPHPVPQSSFVSEGGKGTVGTTSSRIELNGEEIPKLFQIQNLKLGDRKIKVIDLIQAEWKKFARCLEFEEHIIESVGKDYRDSVYDCCCETLKKWLQGSGGIQPANWNTLIEALSDAGKKPIADTLQSYVV